MIALQVDELMGLAKFNEGDDDSFGVWAPVDIVT